MYLIRQVVMIAEAGFNKKVRWMVPFQISDPR